MKKLGNMRRYLLSFFVIILFATAIISYAEQQQQSLQQSLQKLLTQTRDEYQLPSLALSIKLPNQDPINLYSGMVVNGGNVPLGPSNLFQVASITKTFATAIILQLESEGKLSLNDNIGRWFPQFPKWRDITVRQLLNQTTGIPDFIDSPHFWDLLDQNQKKEWPAQELLSMSYNMPMSFMPGKGWEYSNANYVLAGLVIEKVTGKSFDEEIQNRILGPQRLNLTNTFFFPYNYNAYIRQHITHGYHRGSDLTFHNISWLQAAGALISNPGDIVLWGNALYHDKVMPTKQFQEMTQWINTSTGQPLKQEMEMGYGLGIFKLDSPYGMIWLTPGLAPGYRSALVYLPCDDIVMAYSAGDSVSGHEEFHVYFISHILNILLNNAEVKAILSKNNETRSQPSYCHNYIPPRVFSFPEVY